jgi:uncharacterized protein (TIGR02594 family)
MALAPKGYEWLDTIGTLPKMIQEALKLYGTTETPGKANSSIIMGWADEVGSKAIGYKYTGDDVPWCGLFMSVVAKRAGKELPTGPLYATNWSKFGTKEVVAMLGDVLTFKRTGGGHVALYIGEDATCYHVLGGNQHDMVNITRIEKSRLYSISSPVFKTAAPESVRVYKVAANGAVSSNEA